MAKLLYKTELELNFRGERNYIYGPDLFAHPVEEAMKFLKIDTIKDVDFSSHNMAHEGLTLYMFDNPGEENLSDIQSKLIFSSKGKFYYLYLVSNNNKVEKRTPYPEEIVFNSCILNEEQKTISLNKQTDFLLTDNYTALTKYMHNNIYKNITGKWIFVRVKYDEYKLNSTYKELKVAITKNFANKYTQNSLFIDNSKIGTLYFSLI